VNRAVRDHNHSLAGKCAVAFSSDALMIWSMPMDAADDDQVVLNGIEILSRAKSQAESRIKLVRSLVKDGEIDTVDLRRVRILYDDARSDVNAGLDRLLAELEAHGTYATAEPYTQVAERAAARMAELIKISDKLALGEDRGDPVEAGMKLVDTVVKAFVDVWKTLRGERTSRRSLFVQRLGSLRWSPFDDI
jgi:hypothetical protein